MIAQVLNGEEIGTFFAPREKRTSAWGQWIAFGDVRPADGWRWTRERRRPWWRKKEPAADRR